jgi:hypothetical protein
LEGKVYNGFGKTVYNTQRCAWEVEKVGQDGRMRYFISVMSESLVQKGVFFRLRKRDKAKIMFWLFLSKISSTADKKMKKVFVNYINSGGLTLLNELVIDLSPNLIIEVLKVIAGEETPVVMYCTAGKDRTGLISMFVLNILGASDDDIIADYILSEKAYAALNNKKAMVASLEQVDLDPDTFLTARPHVIQHTMEYVRNKYGSIKSFLNEYGFDHAWRMKLKKKASKQVQVQTRVSSVEY